MTLYIRSQIIENIELRNFYWLFFIFSIIILSFSSPVFASDPLCYFRLSIQETKTQQGIIQFSLSELLNLYGSYEGFVDSFPGDYVLKTYDNQGNILNSYSLSSSRFIYWDDFTEGTENPSGVQEVDSGVISTVIPYDSKINRIKIEDYDKTETDLNINPTNIKCEKTCKDENQTVEPLLQTCCQDLIPAHQQDGSYICVKCGDNVCSRYEDTYSCPEDCADSLKTLYVDLKASTDSANWQKSILSATPISKLSLKATVSGTVRGLTTYQFDCQNDGTWDSTVYSSDTPQTIDNICSYTKPGKYTAKVQVERNGISAEDTATIAVISNISKVPLNLLKIVLLVSFLIVLLAGLALVLIRLRRFK